MFQVDSIGFFGYAIQMSSGNDAVSRIILIAFLSGCVLMIVGSVRFANDQKLHDGQIESTERVIFMNITHGVRDEKACENMELSTNCLVRNECYTLRVRRGFWTFKPSLVITSDRTIECNSSDLTCPNAMVNQVMKNQSIWYQLSDFTNWRYEEFSSSESSLTVICWGVWMILNFICSGLFICNRCCAKHSLIVNSTANDRLIPSSEISIPLPD